MQDPISVSSRRQEYACPCCNRVKMDNAFAMCLLNFEMLLFQETGKSPVYTSVYRCEKFNNKVSGTGSTGRHPKGQAADIAFTDKLHLGIIVKCAVKSGIYSITPDFKKKFVHIQAGHPWLGCYQAK